jgi:hypothetical protein
MNFSIIRNSLCFLLLKIRVRFVLIPASLFFAMLASPQIAFAQVGGNATYSMGNAGYGSAYGRARAEQNERAKRSPVAGELSPGTNAMFLEASVLMNVKAEP